MMLKNNVFLIGFMGCGKSTISKMLSEKLGLKMVDSDESVSYTHLTLQTTPYV